MARIERTKEVIVEPNDKYSNMAFLGPPYWAVKSIIIAMPKKLAI
jgi:hypothetical protein